MDHTITRYNVSGSFGDKPLPGKVFRTEDEARGYIYGVFSERIRGYILNNAPEDIKKIMSHASALALAGWAHTEDLISDSGQAGKEAGREIHLDLGAITYNFNISKVEICLAPEELMEIAWYTKDIRSNRPVEREGGVL